VDPHSFSKLDPDPHSLKKLDMDPHKVNAMTRLKILFRIEELSQQLDDMGRDKKMEKEERNNKDSARKEIEISLGKTRS
jgi:hypothetical protein